MNILNYLKVGEDNAISRQSLINIFNTSDRMIRKAIEEERRKGTIICNTQNGKGYFLPSGAEDILKQAIQNRNRAMTILSYQKHLKRELKKHDIKFDWKKETKKVVSING